VRLGDVITCRGKVVAKRPAADATSQNLVDLELWAENQKGDRVITGQATAILLSRQ
jgi:acyl dehydratase